MHVRFPGAEEPCGVVGAGEDHPVDSLVGHQMARNIAVVERGQDHKVLGQAGVVKGAHEFGRAALGRGRRLEDDGTARGQRRRHAPGGDRQREVPRGGDHGQVHRDETGARHVRRIVQEQRGLGIVAAEIDGLADLGVGLVDGLAGLGGGYLDELVSAGGQDVPDPVQDGGPLPGVAASPHRGGGRGRFRNRVDLLGGLHTGGARLDLNDPPLGGGDSGGDVAGPAAVGGQGGVGVRGRGEGPTAGPGGHRRLDGRTRLALGAPVLGPVGRRDGGVGGQVG